jgi:hypothetical protein
VEAAAERAHPPIGLGVGAKLIAGNFLALLLFVVTIAVLFGGGGDSCANGAAGPPATDKARAEIPPRYLRIYQDAGAQFEVAWPFLAGIGFIESGHGTNPAASTVNSSGCVGPMQLGVGGRCGDFVGAYGIDGDGDGDIDPLDPADAVHTAANGLRKGGLPPVAQATQDDYYQAACGYYGACAGYADVVLAKAAEYGGHDWLAGAQGAVGAGAAGCSPASAGAGDVTIAPGANRPGVALQPEILEYLDQVSALSGLPLVVTTGTNHSQFTTSGSVSDHWYGYAADLGITANGGAQKLDRVAAAALVIAGGYDGRHALALAHAGGLWTLYRNGIGYQVIWKTYEGGNHYDHVHLAAHPNG